MGRLLPALCVLQFLPDSSNVARPADDDGDEYNELKRHLERAGDSGD